MPNPAETPAIQTKGRVYLGLILTMVLWGSAFVGSKMIVFDVPPEVGAILRFGLGALLMMGVLFRAAARPIPSRDSWGKIGVAGLAQSTLSFCIKDSLTPTAESASLSHLCSVLLLGNL